MAKKPGINAESTIRAIDQFALAYQNELRGDKIYQTLADLLAEDVDRLQKDCEVRVAEDLIANIPSTTYKLRKLPIVRLSDPSSTVVVHPSDWSDYERIQLTNTVNTVTVNGIEVSTYFLDYYKVTQTAGDFSGTIQEQFAPAYDGIYYDTLSAEERALIDTNRPPFTYDKDPSWNSNNWVDADQITDLTGYAYRRIKFDNADKWSWPVALNSTIDLKGSYLDKRYRWTLGDRPQLPLFAKQDGTRNNKPTGWSDGIPDPGNNTHLWKIYAEKNIFGDLIEEWNGVDEVNLDGDGDTIRYSATGVPNPNDLVNTSTSAAEGTSGGDLMRANGWIRIPGPAHVFQAQRTKNSTNNYTTWIVTKIQDESGSYASYIYKNFDKSLSQYIVNNPDQYTPTGKEPEGWNDKPRKEDGKRTFISRAEFYNNGEFKSPWSAPYPYTEGVPIAAIKATPTVNFKYNSQQDQYENPDITLEALLFDEGTNIISQTDVVANITWKLIHNGGSSVDTDLGSGSTVNINYSQVDGQATIQVTIDINDASGNNLFSDDFIETIELNDIKDGLNIVDIDLISSEIAFFYKGGSYENGPAVLQAIEYNTGAVEGDYTWSYANDYDPATGSGTWTVISAETGSQYNLSTADYDTHRSTNSKVAYKVEVTDLSGTVKSDIFILYRQTIIDGQSSILVRLTNAVTTVNTEPNGDPIGLGGVKTTAQVIEGTGDITSEYDNPVVTEVSKVNDGQGADDGYTFSVTGKEVAITDWGNNLRQLRLQLDLSHTGATKTDLGTVWTLDRSKGLQNVYQLTLTSSNGRVLGTHSGETSTTFSTILYLNGIQESAGDYYFEWYVGGSKVADGASGSGVGNDSYTVNAGDVGSSAVIEVKVYDGTSETDPQVSAQSTEVINIDATRERQFIYLVQKTAYPVPSAPNSTYANIATTSDFSGTNKTGWMTSQDYAASLVNNAPSGEQYYLFETFKYDDEGSTAWKIPRRVTGEKGASGFNGGETIEYFCVTDFNVQPPLPSVSAVKSGTADLYSNRYKNEISVSNVTYKLNDHNQEYSEGEAVYKIWAFIHIDSSTGLYVHSSDSNGYIWNGPVKVSGEKGPDGEVGPMPDHEWRNGSELRFEKPGNVWGVWQDLKGPKGDKGSKPDHQWVDTTKLQFEKPDGTWGTATELQGPQGVAQGISKYLVTDSIYPWSIDGSLTTIMTINTNNTSIRSMVFRASVTVENDNDDTYIVELWNSSTVIAQRYFRPGRGEPTQINLTHRGTYSDDVWRIRVKSLVGGTATGNILIGVFEIIEEP